MRNLANTTSAVQEIYFRESQKELGSCDDWDFTDRMYLLHELRKGFQEDCGETIPAHACAVAGLSIAISACENGRNKAKILSDIFTHLQAIILYYFHRWEGMPSRARKALNGIDEIVCDYKCPPIS